MNNTSWEKVFRLIYFFLEKAGRAEGRRTPDAADSNDNELSYR